MAIANQNLIDKLAYGVKWADNSSTCTRVGNLEFHKTLPIQNGLRGCVHRGGKVVYYLDANNWAYKDDGTASNLDGTDGDVGIDTSYDFYYKGFNESGYRYMYISLYKVDSSWNRMPRLIIDAYRCSIDTGVSPYKTCSVVSTATRYRGGGNRTANDTYVTSDPCRSDLNKPRTSQTRATMRQYAFNAGGALLTYEFYKMIFYWLYVIEYANFNSQAAYNANLTSDGYRQGGLGNGVTTWDSNSWTAYNGSYPLTPNGFGNGFGNKTGIKTMTVGSKTFDVPRWRGFDNPFGDTWTLLDSIVIQQKDTTWKNVYITSDSEATLKVNTLSDLNSLALDTISSAFSKIGEEYNNDGYIGEIVNGSKGEIIPINNSGNTTVGKCDYHWAGNKDTSLRCLILGGGARDGAPAGLAAFSSSHGVGLSASSVGFRGCFKFKGIA